LKRFRMCHQVLGCQNRAIPRPSSTRVKFRGNVPKPLRRQARNWHKSRRIAWTDWEPRDAKGLLGPQSTVAAPPQT